jgi:hypothetical protein
LATAPYDTIETILNATRTRINDSIASLAGDVLTDNQPFTTQMVNSAWRRLQRRLADLGYVSLEKEVILPLPAMTNSDPAVFMWISWTGCFDGTVVQTSPVLPQDLISPTKRWERPTGSAADFIELDNIDGGLDAVAKMNWNQQSEWRNDAIWIPGAVPLTDLRVRYAAYYADFTSISANPSQVVPIMQCLDPFSNYIASEMANSRADLDGATFDQKAEAGAVMIAQRQSAAPRGIGKDAEYGKSKDRFTPVAGGAQ